MTKLVKSERRHVTETRNPACVGWNFTLDSGTEVQILWLQGMSRLHLYMRSQVSGEWVSTGAMDTEKWGVPEGTLDNARATVQRFIDEGDETDG